MKTRVLLLGCGYTSIWSYNYLLRYSRKSILNGSIEITLLSNSDHHVFHGFTGEFLSGFLPLSFNENHYSKIMKHVKFISGTVKSINQLKHTVNYISLNEKTSKILSYDHLVLGIGSTDNNSHIPNLNKLGISIKKKTGIQECRQRIIKSINKASLTNNEKEIKKHLSFVIIGGGFTGIELCGNLCEYLESLKQKFPVLENGYQVYLIHSNEQLLSQLHNNFSKMRKYAEKILKNYGVKIISNSKLIRVENDYVVLDNNQTIETTVPIYAIGQKRIPPKSELPFAISNENTIVTDDKLRAEGYNNIWVGGDIAYVRKPFTNKTCRADALWAIKHGTKIGKNLSRAIKGKKPKKFIFPGLGQTASFGKNKAILELYGFQFTGIIAWYIRIGFFLYFYPNKKRVLKVIKGMFAVRNLESAN